MTRYKNISGKSGILAYETGRSYIRVRYRDAIYRYDHAKPGKEAVETMKELAAKGKGLSTFISRYVQDHYSVKEEA